MELILRAKYSYDIIFARTFWLITPDREFAMKNQELSFCIIFRRTSDKIFQKKKKKKKNSKYHIFGFFLPKLGQK